MLFRQFMLITTGVALIGIAVSHAIESTRPQARGISVEQRLKEWKRHDEKRKCADNPKLCLAYAFPVQQA